MKKIKILTIFGTRPEATKMAPILNKFKTVDSVDSLLCVTAQHRDMLDQALAIFNLTPDFDLDIMKKGQSLTEITTRALSGLESVIRQAAPDLVLVHGDTTSTFVGALAAFYNKVPVGHVEAGLRTFDKYQPFPEEINRRLTCSLADLHFSPTDLARQNLLREGVKLENIFVTGNTAVDCLKTTVREDYIFTVPELNNIDYKSKRVLTMTAHRRENLGEPLYNICRAALSIVQNHQDVELVYAVHSNPAVQSVAREVLGNNKRIHLVAPLDMLDMHNLMKRSFLLLTDSGGIQEEAPGLNKPVVVLRNVTERPEGIEAGTLELAGTDTGRILASVNNLLNDDEKYNRMANARNPFGDGEAAERIVKSILYFFGLNEDRPVDYL